MRIAQTVSLIALAACLTGCDTAGRGGNNPAAPSGPPAAGSTIVYTAIGASDVIGYGSSNVCLPFDDCNGNGYVWVAKRMLQSQGFTVKVSPLGIPTSVISRSFQDLAIQNGRTDILGNFLDQEVPFVDRDASLVTIFVGANDVNVITEAVDKGAGGSNPSAYIDQKVAAFGADYGTLLAGIRARAKSAHIVVFNVPNLAATPYLAGATLAQKQAAQRAAVGITTTVINTAPGTTVIDLMCDPRLYQPSIFSSDGFHPNDSGYALLGAEVVSATTSSSYPAPKGSCSQMTAF